MFAILLVSVLSCEQPESPAANAEASYNPDLYGWKTASWSPFTVADTIKGFAYGNGVYVAAGINGIIAWSYDGDIWEPARKAPASDNTVTESFNLEGGGAANFNAVAFGDGVFIAVADDGHLAYSYDGISWTGIHSVNGFGTEDINGIAYGAGCFVAVGDGGNISVALSLDPKSWAGGNVSGFSAINSVSFGDGKFYAAGNDGWTGWAAPPAPLTPADSWNWHPRQWTDSATSYKPPGAAHIRGIAFGEYGTGESGLGIVFDEYSGGHIALCSAARFEDGDKEAWDPDIDSGFFGNNRINGIVWSPAHGGVWLAAGQSAMIGYWPSSAPKDNTERYWRALSFAEFRWWEITALAVLNGRYFTGGIGGKIGYGK